jgi:hypothetical protein
LLQNVRFCNTIPDLLMIAAGLFEGFPSVVES